MSSVSRFWQESERYHDLAEEFERNIEIVTPKVATGGKNDCWICPNACPWCATRVTYIEHRP